MTAQPPPIDPTIHNTPEDIELIEKLERDFRALNKPNIMMEVVFHLMRMKGIKAVGQDIMDALEDRQRDRIARRQKYRATREKNKKRTLV